MTGIVRILSVVGTRPNFVKLAPVHKALKAAGTDHVILHTGQHYNPNLSDSFFRDLGIPAADINLEIGSGTHAQQTAKALLAMEPYLLKDPKPDWVLVYGDVNSTLAATLCAKKVGLRVGHIEAGIRHIHEDFSIPEELNRIMADHISDLLFAPTTTAARNLKREGISPGKIALVGNTMFDSLIASLPKARRRNPLTSAVLRRRLPPDLPFILLTLHRPENVDDPETFVPIWEALSRISEERTILFPMHPRTQKMIREFGIDSGAARSSRIVVCEPLGYIDFLALMIRSDLVMTDSGSIQDETSFLGVPCFTIRNNSDRPETIERKFNRLTGNHPKKILLAWRRHLLRHRRRRHWPARRLVRRVDDGRAAIRIVAALKRAGSV